MNDWNQWEHLLSGWVPRRPSPKVKRRLFPSAPAAKHETPWAISWHWFAVASSFALLAVILGLNLLDSCESSGRRTSRATKQRAP